MKIHMHLSTTLAAVALLLAGTLAHAQAVQTTAAAAKTQAASTTTVQGRDAASGMATGRRQDQFGHASGLAADNAGTGAQTEDKSMGSAHATESLQKKHIAGVKYEDRAAAPTGAAPGGEPGKMGINEQGVPGKPPTTTNKIAIKENGVSKATAGADTVQPYKDPEDMTTRYRPGNNKTTKVNSSKPATTAKP